MRVLVLMTILQALLIPRAAFAIEQKIPCMVKKRARWVPAKPGEDCVQMNTAVYKKYVISKAKAKTYEVKDKVYKETEKLHAEQVKSLKKETDLLRKLNKVQTQVQSELKKDRDYWKRTAVDLSKPRPVPAFKHPVLWGVVGVVAGAAITAAVIYGVKAYMDSQKVTGTQVAGMTYSTKF